MAELTKAVTTMASKREEPAKEEKLTPEQEEERWAVYNPGKTKPDFYKKFFRLAPEATEEDLKELRDLFDDMQRGFVKQSVTGAKNLFDVELKKIQAKIAEIDGYVSEAQTEKIRTQFYGGYPALDKPEYKKIVSLTAAALDPKDYKTNEDYFKALAERAAETIKGVLPTFELGAEEKGTKKPSGTPPRLPRGTRWRNGWDRSRRRSTSDNRQ